DLTRAAELCAELGARAEHAAVLTDIGAAHHRAGDHEAALASLRAARAIREGDGRPELAATHTDLALEIGGAR
ncbi:MAG TPA: hypothetical protein VGF17_06455, partial [Phytomonospora sp.]